MRIVLTLTIMVSVLGILTAQPIRKTGVDTTVVVNNYIQDEYSAFRDANTPAKVDLLYAPKLIKRFLGPGSDTIKYTYNTEGRLLSRQEVDEHGQQAALNNYGYDAWGNLTLYQYYGLDKLLFEQKWTYNNKGNPTSLKETIGSFWSSDVVTEVTYEYNSFEKETVRREKYTPVVNGLEGRVIYSIYDSSQVIKQRNWYQLINNSEIPEKREIIAFPEPMNTQETSISLWKDSIWVNYEQYINYDSLGFMNSITQRKWSGEAWVDTLRTTRRFTESGEQKELRNEYYTANRWWLSNINYNEYDTLGRVLYSIYDVGHEDYQLHYWRRIYTYDDEGNVKTDELQFYRVLYYVPNEKNWINYDNHGNATLVSCYKWAREYWAAGVGECIVRYNRGKNVESINAAFVAIEYNSFTSINEGETPNTFTLSQNYPNPFNPNTKIGFTLSRTQQVSVRVFDVLGQHISTLFDGIAQAGTHTVEFTATELPSGVYFYRIDAAEGTQIKKMVLMK